jgi:hypothetical protein
MLDGTSLRRLGLTRSAKRRRLENRRRYEEQMPSALLSSSTLSNRGVRGR